MLKINEKTKTILVEIRNNESLSKDMLDDRMKALAFDAVTAMSKKAELSNYKNIVKIFAEMVDIWEITERKGGKNEE